MKAWHVIGGVVFIGLAIYILCKLRPKGTVIAMESEATVTPSPGMKAQPNTNAVLPGKYDAGLGPEYETVPGAKQGTVGYQSEYFA